MFSGASLVLAENEISDWAFLAKLFFLTIIGRPSSEKKRWAKHVLAWIGFPIEATNENEECGVFESKSRFAIGILRILLSMGEPTLNQVQSVAVSSQWASQMRHWVRPFLSDKYDYTRYRTDFKKNRPAVSRFRNPYSVRLFNPVAVFNAPVFLRRKTKSRNLPRRMWSVAVRKIVYNWESAIGIWGGEDSIHKRYSRRICIARSKRKIPPAAKGGEFPTQTN